MDVISYRKNQYKGLKRKKAFRKIYLILGGVFLFLLLAIYLLFFANIFSVESIKIYSDKNQFNNEIQNLAESYLNKSFFGIKLKSNFIFVSNDNIKNLLLSNFSFIENAIIEIKNHILEINIDSRTPIGVWCINEKSDCYYFDKSYILFSESNATEGYIYLIVNDQRKRNINIGEKINNTGLLDKFFDIRSHLQRNGFEVAEYIINDEYENEYSALVSEKNTEFKKFKLIFSEKGEYELQIKAFTDIYYKKLETDKKSNLEYFDLRVKDRIYYK